MRALLPNKKEGEADGQDTSTKGNSVEATTLPNTSENNSIVNS